MVPLVSPLVKQGGPATRWTNRYFIVELIKALLPCAATFCPDLHVIQEYFFRRRGLRWASVKEQSFLVHRVPNYFFSNLAVTCGEGELVFHEVAMS